MSAIRSRDLQTYIQPDLLLRRALGKVVRNRHRTPFKPAPQIAQRKELTRIDRPTASTSVAHSGGRASRTRKGCRSSCSFHCGRQRGRRTEHSAFLRIHLRDESGFPFEIAPRGFQIAGMAIVHKEQEVDQFIVTRNVRRLF